MADPSVRIIIRATDQTQRAFLGFSDRMARMLGISKQAAIAMTGFGVAVGAASVGIYKTAKAAIEFESAFAGVRKTIDASEETYARLESDIMALSRSIPIAATELARIAELGGQLGVSAGGISAFAETVAQLTATTNLSAEQAAMDLARIAKVTGETEDNFEMMGSVIVELGNNFATTESEITHFANRISGMAKMYDMTSASIFGWSAAMSSLGIRAEMGGSAFMKFAERVEKAVATGEDLEKWAKIAGISISEFSNLFETDFNEAILMVLKGMSDMQTMGQSLTLVLADLGITERRETQMLKKTAAGYETVAASMKSQAEEAEKVEALSEEFGKRAKTTESQLKLLSNRWFELKEVIGKEFLPSILDSLEAMEDFITYSEPALRELGQVGAEAFSRISDEMGDFAKNQAIMMDETLTWSDRYKLMTAEAFQLAVEGTESFGKTFLGVHSNMAENIEKEIDWMRKGYIEIVDENMKANESIRKEGGLTKDHIKTTYGVLDRFMGGTFTNIKDYSKKAWMVVNGDAQRAADNTEAAWKSALEDSMVDMWDRVVERSTEDFESILTSLEEFEQKTQEEIRDSKDKILEIREEIKVASIKYEQDLLDKREEFREKNLELETKHQESLEFLKMSAAEKAAALVIKTEKKRLEKIRELNKLEKENKKLDRRKATREELVDREGVLQSIVSLEKQKQDQLEALDDNAANVLKNSSEQAAVDALELKIKEREDWYDIKEQQYDDAEIAMKRAHEDELTALRDHNNDLVSAQQFDSQKRLLREQLDVTYLEKKRALEDELTELKRVNDEILRIEKDKDKAMIESVKKAFDDREAAIEDQLEIAKEAHETELKGIQEKMKREEDYIKKQKDSKNAAEDDMKANKSTIRDLKNEIEGLDDLMESSHNSKIDMTGALAEAKKLAGMNEFELIMYNYEKDKELENTKFEEKKEQNKKDLQEEEEKLAKELKAKKSDLDKQLKAEKDNLLAKKREYNKYYTERLKQDKNLADRYKEHVEDGTKFLVENLEERLGENALFEKRDRKIKQWTDRGVSTYDALKMAKKIKLPSYDVGGVVPGATGAPQMAIVHGGERITPPGQGGGVYINLSGNFYGSDRQFADKLSNMIVQKVKNNTQFVNR